LWRRQEETKPSSPAPDFAVSPAPEQSRPLAAQPADPGTAAGNLSRTISIKGEVTGREDLFVDGDVHGSVRITHGNVTVGPNGRVTADIEAHEIVVRGTVKGTLRGQERVHIGRTGQVTGDVVTRHLVVDEGAILSGKVDVARAEEERGSRATPKEATRPAVHATEPKQ
jgi:cytoskeletal protein CcmA (bactofilin family)